MTTTVLSLKKCIHDYAEWKHPEAEPKNVEKKYSLIYNCAATCAAASIAGIVAALALTCIPTYTMMGLLLTVTFSASYCSAAELAHETAPMLEPISFQPVAFEIPLGIVDFSIELFRCHSIPIQTTGGKRPISEKEYEHKHNEPLFREDSID